MRSAARPILAVVLLVVLLGAALSTRRVLGDVDPRGRASWAAAPLSFDATPRDVALFVPACEARAVVLHPAGTTSGRVEATFFTAAPDGSATRAGAVHAISAPGTPIELPLDAVRPPWRSPLVVRLTADHLLTLDAARPITITPAHLSLFGTLACAFDNGSAAATWMTATGTLVVLLVSGMLAMGWLAVALLGQSRVLPPPGGTAAALLLAGATTVVFGLVVPPFEPPDELAHMQYARFVATTGTLPREVPPPDSEWRASSYEFVQQPLYYLGAAAVLRAAGLATPGPALVLNPRSRLQPGGTEPTIFQHGSSPTPSTGHQALRLLRIGSLLMALATTWVIARLLLTVTADPLVVATVAGGLGLIPQWCAVMGAVSTDPPATLLAATATLAVVEVARGRDRTSWLLLTGALIGAAFAVKATAMFLAPMAILACLIDAANRAHAFDVKPSATVVAAVLQRTLRPVLVIGVGIALTAGWILVRAWLVFGDPHATAFKRAVLEAGGFVPTPQAMPWTREFWTQLQVMVFEPFWARFGSLGAGPFPGSTVWLAYAAASALLLLLAAIGVAGWVRAGLRENRQRAPGLGLCTALPLAVCSLGVGVGLAAWVGVNLFPRADMIVHWTPRHILPLTAPAAVLVAAGLERLRHARPLAHRGASAAVGLTIVALSLAWLGVLRATALMFHFGY